MTRLTKTGIVLSILPFLPYLPLVLSSFLRQEVLLGDAIFFVGVTLFLSFPLLVIYVIYVVMRLIKFPKRDPAYGGVRCLSLVILGGLFLFPIGLTGLAWLEERWGVEIWLPLYVLVEYLPYLIVLASPFAEGILYWKMRPRRRSLD